MKIFATDFEDNLLEEGNNMIFFNDIVDDNYLKIFFCARIPRLKADAFVGISSSSAEK